MARWRDRRGSIGPARYWHSGFRVRRRRGAYLRCLFQRVNFHTVFSDRSRARPSGGSVGGTVYAATLGGSRREGHVDREERVFQERLLGVNYVLHRALAMFAVLPPCCMFFAAAGALQLGALAVAVRGVVGGMFL